jgi:hypothetical protein
MKNYKLGTGLIYAFIASIPFVAADIKAGPEIYVIPFIGLALIGGFIVGSVFLIRWIIRKIKNKQ